MNYYTKFLTQPKYLNSTKTKENKVNELKLTSGQIGLSLNTGFRKLVCLLALIFIILPEQLQGYGSGTTKSVTSSKFYGKAAGEVTGINLLIAGFDRYVANFDFARISLNTMKENLTHRWVWDGDNFVTNQLGHPLQGNIYFNSARTSGFNYWESLGFVAIGSLQWELFMENTYPSMNDFITTTLSGTLLGEVFYRLFALVYRKNISGFEWLWRNTTSLILNPVAYLNTTLWPNTFRESSNFANYHTHLKFTAGTKLRTVVGRKNCDKQASYVPYPSIDLWMVYGDPFSGNLPLDFFIMNIGFSFDNNIIANLSISGQLWKHFLQRKGNVNTIIEVIQDFDFYESPDYKVGDVILGVGLSSRLKLKDNLTTFLKLSTGFIPLGGASTEYFVQEERDYNIGYGFGGKLKFIILWKNFGSFNMELNRFAIKTMSGAAGTEDITMGKVEGIKLLYKKIGVAFSYLFYYRIGNYVEYPSVRSFNKELRVLLTLGFD